MKPIAITENHLYKKVYLGGKRAGGYYTVVYVLKDKKAYRLKKENPQKKYVNRIGISVSKKIGKAVQRNRAKRVIREALAETEKECVLKKGYLVVISAREAATVAKSTDVQAEMKKLLEKLDMLENTALKNIDSSERAENTTLKNVDSSETAENTVLKNVDSSERAENTALKNVDSFEKSETEEAVTESPVPENIEKGDFTENSISENSESTSEIPG